MRSQRKTGVVLIIVLVVVVTLSLSAYTFSSLMLTHRRAAKLTGQQLQARLLVDSGVEMVKYLLSQDEASRQEAGGVTDNVMMFQGISVMPAADLDSRGSFAVISPLPNTSGLGLPTGMGGGVRYGLEDESSRLNLNLVLLAGDSGRDLLMGIPGMNEEIADAILDWMDEDDEPRESGAEFDFYSQMNPPYEPRNGPLMTVEELLLVRGVTANLLFGSDQNRNTISDAHELGIGGAGGGGAAMTATTIPSGQTNHRGWSAYLTIYSGEKNATAEGLPRIHLNQEDMQLLHEELSAVFSVDWANFIVAYRIYGPHDGNEDGEPASGIQLDLESAPSASAEIGQVLDLIGAKVPIGGSGGEEGQAGGQGGGQGGGGDEATIFDSPFSDDPAEMENYLQQLMDNCTVLDAPVIPGRLNVNEASAELLQGIPGMTEEIYQTLIDQREVISSDPANRSHETWLLQEQVLTLAEMKALTPYICAGGDVFRAQIVGYYQGGGPSTRVEVVFDATEAEPRVVLWRDISHLGRGYSLQMLGVDLTGSQ